jgi:hypothetical protein
MSEADEELDDTFDEELPDFLDGEEFNVFD